MRPILLLVFVLFFSLSGLFAQDDAARRFFKEADSLRCAYRFEQAINVYQQAIAASAVSDSLFRRKAQISVVYCENGMNLLQYATKPEVLGRIKISKSEFYSYYDFGTSGFLAVNMPVLFLNSVDKSMFPLVEQEHPVFVSTGAKTMILTGRDKNTQKLNLYISRLQSDSLWSFPELMEATVNSPGDNCWPYLTPDGRMLFFASNGHYGMGGFNLYVSYFDESAGWSQAQNLGFPYSSPEDDLFFVPAPDGSSALFSSGRGGLVDSVHLYKIGYELNPAKYDLRGKDSLFFWAQMHPDKMNPINTEIDTLTSVSPSTQDALSGYSAIVQKARKLQDEVKVQEKKLAKSRELYAQLSLEEERQALAGKIAEGELLLIDLQEKYRQAGIEVQQVETEFLNKGVLPPVVSGPVQKNRETELGFNPVKQQIGSVASYRFAPYIAREEPVNMVFRIEEESQIVPEEKKPLSLFYRIQLLVGAQKADAAFFKGISPVFESKNSAGKYVYAAGQFYRHADATKALGQVQRKGMKNAGIIAYNEGKGINVTVAQKLEKMAPKASYRISLGAYAQGIPESLLVAIKELSNKDIAKIVGEEGAKYVLGPFSTQQEAEALRKLLVEKGFEGIELETIRN